MRSSKERPRPEDHPIVIVLGPDSFWNVKYLCKKMNELVAKLPRSTILTGTNTLNRAITRGVAQAADEWCGKKWLFQMRFHPPKGDDSEMSGRNQEMLDYAVQTVGKKRTFVVLFYNDECPGTRNMLKKCKKAGVKCRLLKPDPSYFVDLGRKRK